jgi:hypothetical protein
MVDAMTGRSGYSDDCEHRELWRASVDRAINGKRGQKFLREMGAALDAMPVKELVSDEIVRDDGHVCAIGAVALTRGLSVSEIDPYDPTEVGKKFGIARAMAAEIAYENDRSRVPYFDGKRRQETPSERWHRMREWVRSNLRPEPDQRP